MNRSFPPRLPVKLLFRLLAGSGMILAAAPPAGSMDLTREQCRYGNACPCIFFSYSYDDEGTVTQFAYDLVQSGGCTASPAIHIVAEFCKRMSFSGSDWRSREFILSWNHQFQEVDDSSPGIAAVDSIPWVANIIAWGRGEQGSFQGQVTVAGQTTFLDPTQSWDLDVDVRGKWAVPPATEGSAAVNSAGLWSTEQRLGISLGLTQDHPVGYCAQVNAVLDPVVMVDPEWEHASDWVVFQRAMNDSGPWVRPTRDWMSTWTDVTPPVLQGNGGGGAWGDYDQDGDPDLFVAWRATSGSRLYRNDGPGGFVELVSSPLFGLPSAMHGAWGDFDNDGDLDIFVGKNNQPCQLFRCDGGDVFVDVTPPALTLSEQVYASGWADYDLDGDLDLYVVIADSGSSPTATNRLYRNDGGGGFTDVTSGPLGARGYCTSVAWGDYDNDGDPDLYFCGWGQALLRNDGGGVFADATPEPLNGSLGFRSAGWADFDNDGWLDVMGTNAGAGALLVRNLGGGAFADSTDVLRATRNLAGTMALGDLDNDGYIDMQEVSQDALAEMLFNIEGQFCVNAAMMTDGGLPSLPGGNSVGAADFDGDGDLDLYAGSGSEGSLLLRNDSSGAFHWVRFRLHGVTSNRSGIGARIRVVAGGRQQIREVNASTRLRSGDAMEPWFGLGVAAVIDTIEVRWPSGTVDRSIGPIALDRTIVLTEGTVVVGVPSPREGGGFTLFPPYPNPSGQFATIRFELSSPERVTLGIYDVAGRRVRTLMEGGLREKGLYTMVWNGLRDDGGRAGDGLYFCRLRAGSQIQTSRLLMLR